MMTYAVLIIVSLLLISVGITNAADKYCSKNPPDCNEYCVKTKNETGFCHGPKGKEKCSCMKT
uniref:Defensin-5 n=1 Tax=Androctonus bicolor TaxID=748906 RepID=A0A0K0LBS5_9SCOR|nr:defensin-5 [Androctonus bicolor]